MPKRLVQLLTVALCVFLSTCICFASPVMVSPSANSVVSGDSVLVSVKLTEKQTIRVSVFREMEESKAAVFETVTDENGIEKQVQISPAEYKNYDASRLTEADITLLAQGNTTDPKGNEIKLSTGAPVKPLYGKLVGTPVEFTNSSDVGFYTKQLSKLDPGLYMIQVDVLGAKKAEEAAETGAAVENSGEEYEIKESVRTLVALKEKPKEEPVTGSGIFGPTKSTAWQLIQNILKSLFR